jgi:UDP-galactopyranose mutase
MITKPYDYLVVGAGLFGCVFAHEMQKLGKKCLIVEKREHPGGNIYCRNIDGINVHLHGAHIFHTNDRKIWNYVNQFVEFNAYTHTVLARYKNELYNLPFNMNTFYRLWNVSTPEEAVNIIRRQQQHLDLQQPANLEEQAIALVGTDIYEKLIKGYTEKQWGRKAADLPAFIIKRLPLRFTFNNNYFDDAFQGIPKGGYNKLIDGLTAGIEVRLNVDYSTHRYELNQLAENVVFTGAIDEYYHFSQGRLEYRSLSFEHTMHPCANYQGAAVINYTDAETPYTRTIEHKHFEYGRQPFTIVTYEYPKEWKPGDEQYYPVNDERNRRIYSAYKKLAAQESHVFFGGRLAEYRYYDMDQVIASALTRVKQLSSREFPAIAGM